MKNIRKLFMNYFLSVLYFLQKNTEEEEEFNKFLNSTGIGQLPSISVKPTPGELISQFRYKNIQLREKQIHSMINFY